MFINKEIAQLIILQRNELINPTLQKIRKIFGRRFFTNFVSKYLITPKLIGDEYFSIMQDEYEIVSKFIDLDNKNVLSIGSGLCGLELIIDRNHSTKKFSIIEKDYVSKKVVYGWDKKNYEAYNKLSLVELFLINNGMSREKFEIFDFDTKNLPYKNFDIIISLYSLDYHYNFEIYLDYFRKVFKKDSKIIFDTIRADYFKNLFDNVKIISSKDDTVHKSKRIICEGLKF